jgi:hypothetical protein
MLLIYTRTSNSIPLKIFSIEDGTVLMSFSHLLHHNKKVDFIEQFNEKLLVKQEGENLQILDVWVLTHAPNVGKELPANRSEQDRVYELICLYFSV